MGSRIPLSKRKYYEKKNLLKLQHDVGGSYDSYVLSLKKGFVKPNWVFASNGEGYLNLEYFERDKQHLGHKKFSLDEHYFNWDSFVKDIKKFEGLK